MKKNENKKITLEKWEKVEINWKKIGGKIGE